MATTTEQTTLTDVLNISSAAFTAMGSIPSKYTCDGANVNPPIEISGIPEKTQSLVLIVDDPDAPRGTWDHWIVWNIPPQPNIAENSIPGLEGLNDFGKHHYGGPCPPSGTHRYFFKVYALDQMLELPANTRKGALEIAMKGHILAYGELVGRYQREGY